jgi:hypothetical protein
VLINGQQDKEEADGAVRYVPEGVMHALHCKISPPFPACGTHHPSRREADFVIWRMTDVLREYGTDLSHAIRLDQYHPNPRAVAAYHLSRYDNFGDTSRRVLGVTCRIVQNCTLSRQGWERSPNIS